MKKKIYEIMKWLVNTIIATIAWTFIFQVIDDFQYVDWGICEMIYDGDWDGAVYCAIGTACIAQTFRNISKWVINSVKEIKGI